MKYIRKINILMIVVVLLLNSFTIGFATKNISLYINGSKLPSEYSPVIVNDRTIAPVRVIIEYLGAEVKWDSATKTVTIINNDDVIKLTINNKQVTKNNSSMVLDVPPSIIDSRTFVPLRFVSEVLGYEVEWNGLEKSVSITSPQVPQAEITEMISARVGENQAVLLKINGDYKYKTMSLSNPPRFVIDFADTKFAASSTSVDVNSDYFNKARASQLSFNPLTARVVLDCTEANGFPHLEEQQGGYLAIYFSDQESDDSEDTGGEIPIEPPVDKPSVSREVYNIKVNGLSDYSVDSVLNVEQEDVYGTISSARVNLRNEPSTADSDTIVATINGGTKLKVVGQTYGWYQVEYKNQTLWVADFLLTLDLEMKRDNVNVRSGPSTSFDVVDTVLRGDRIKVLERKPEWVKVSTSSGKEGYIADWLVGINERLVDGDVQGDNIAKEISLTLKNVNINDVKLPNNPSIIKSSSKSGSGRDVIVKIVLTEPISYRVEKTQEGLSVAFGSALQDIAIAEEDGRVTINMTFDMPVKYTVFQNFLEESLLLDFAHSQAVTEQLLEVEGNIAESVQVSNTNDSTQLLIKLENLGSYKINTIGYSSNVQVVLLNSSLSGKVIALDPGHGGKDSGAGSGGVHEKDINLAVSLKIRDILIEKGVTVVMTREHDQSMSLEERVSFVNSMNADIAISVHSNSSDYGGSGVETIYYPKSENERLARILQDGLVTATGFRSRGIKPWERIYFTRNSEMPSALIEMGFITNSGERQFLTSEEGQQRLAENIVTAIERFFMYK